MYIALTTSKAVSSASGANEAATGAVDRMTETLETLTDCVTTVKENVQDCLPAELFEGDGQTAMLKIVSLATQSLCLFLLWNTFGGILFVDKALTCRMAHQVISFYQVVSSFLNFNVKWPQFITDAMLISQNVNFSVLTLPGLCHSRLIVKLSVCFYSLNITCFLQIAIEH